MSVIFVILVIVVNFSTEFEFDTTRVGNLVYEERSVLEQKCGQRYLPGLLQKRSIGGVKVEKGEFPWTLLLEAENRRCSAAMISWRHALTAAHCFVDTKVCESSGGNYGIYTSIPASSISIPVTTSTEHKDYRVVNMTFHPQYNPCSHDSDLVLLEMSPHLFQGRAPICMPTKDEDIPASLTATGYGFNPNVSGPIDEAYAVNLTVTESGRSNYIFTSTYQKAMCKGDSGGPLFKYDGHRYTLVGITSTGAICSGQATEWRSAFVDVRYYLEWVCENSGACTVQNKED